MNRFNWTYIDNRNKRHSVGMMHGAKSGHLLVYCDADIVLIDFKVLHSKSYSFFIEEELCEFNIEKRGKEYLYSFDVNTDADTPLNRQRKKIEKKHLHQSLLFLGGALLLILSFSLGVTYWNQFGQRQNLAIGNLPGKETLAKISISPETEERLVTYFFVADGQGYTTKAPLTELLPAGMPIEGGDEFIVKYVANNPKINKIDYNRPSKRQIDTYRTRAIDRHLEFHPELDWSYCSCVADIVYSMYGLNGLANLYFQRTSPEDNPNRNVQTYKRMVRNPEFIERVEERCWD